MDSVLLHWQVPRPVHMVELVTNVLHQGTSANVFVGSLKAHRSTKFSIMHACYGEALSSLRTLATFTRRIPGLGAFASPLAATHFAAERRWSFHFLVSLGIAIPNMFSVAGVYRLRTMEREQFL